MFVLISNYSNVQSSWTHGNYNRSWKGQQSFVKRGCALKLLELTEGVSKNACKEVPICYGRISRSHSVAFCMRGLSPRMDN